MLLKKLTAVTLILFICLSMTTAFASGTDQPTLPTSTTGQVQPVTQDNVISIATVQAANLNLPCKGAVLMNTETGTILFEKEAETQMPIASITKVMTLLLTLEAVERGEKSLDDIVPISEHAYSMGGSQIWLEPGEQFTLDELIKAICIQSANDAAVAVAEFVGTSEDMFVNMMNERAQQLGMQNTTFKNACGLDEDGHLSCAKDVAIMSRELLKHPKILEYSNMWTDTLRNGETQLTNTNKLLKRYSGITGLKTGTTGKAGVCISATATRDNMGLIAVVLGSVNSEDRFTSATMLLDYGYSNYQMSAIEMPTDIAETLPVKKGVEKAIKVNMQLPKFAFANKGDGQNLSVKVQLDTEIVCPIAQGDVIGKAMVYQGENKIFEYNITSNETVEKINFNFVFNNLIKSLFKI